jgi:hypothetical protein
VSPTKVITGTEICFFPIYGGVDSPAGKERVKSGDKLPSGKWHGKRFHPAQVISEMSGKNYRASLSKTEQIETAVKT